MAGNSRWRAWAWAWVAGGWLAAAAAAAQPLGATASPLKVVRYSFPIAETGFDPVPLSDIYSRTVTEAIFEAPLRYDYLARPFRVRPLTLTALPEVSSDFRVFTFHVQPGIRFADDPAFKGKPRELVAEDYVYAIKRHYDPRLKAANLYLLENAGVVGMAALRQRSLDRKTPFDYDGVVEGLRTLDRYTFQVRLLEPAPRFAEQIMTDSSLFGAVAREVVEYYGDKIAEHPVGTGPFRLADWRRSSRIVLERNPGYRETYYDEQAPQDDAGARAIAAALKGRRMPMVDRVEIAIIPEEQPRWLAFLNREQDVMDRLPSQFINVAMPNGELAPNLRKRGIVAVRAPLVDSLLAAVFNTENPVVGGNTPERVALRRAISLAYDSAEELRLVRKGQAVQAQGVLSPTSYGYIDTEKTEMSDHDPARAKALLDLYGYVDRDGDGWRDRPDGSPLVLEYATQPDQLSRQLAELWQKAMKAVGLRMVFKVAQWPENLKSSRAGKLMMWGVAWSAGTPDGDTFLSLAYGPNKGQSNHSRFDLPAYNAIYAEQTRLPDGPRRQALMTQADHLIVAYAPYKVSGHRVATDLLQPWVMGYRRNPFMRSFFRFVDIDLEAKQRLDR